MKRGEGAGRCFGIAVRLRYLFGAIVLILTVHMLHTLAWARVGGPCVNCHTMHNSQNGTSVVDASIGLQPALTTTDCVGCHSNAGTSTIVDLGDGTRIPIVFSAGEPIYPADGSDASALAGGNFYWVATQGDVYGHNVFGISGIDGLLADAPGRTVSSGGTCNNCHQTLATPESGCRGCHLPMHHADDSIEVVGQSGGWYRFLGDLMRPQVFGLETSNGVMGIEDEDWEQNPSSSNHNGYFGTVDLYTKSHIEYLYDYSVGQFCSGCHGNFHHEMNSGQAGAGNDVSGAWIRHPSDVLIPDAGEYAAYTAYDPLAPAAKPDLAGMKDSSSVVPGTDIVTCISCHRPHGSPYPDMLRWDYESCSAGSASSDCGCYVCHTAKDN